MKLYLAGPLFTQAEQNWLRDLKSKILVLAAKAGKEIDVVWPYELVSPEDMEKWGENTKYEIFALCEKHLKETDVPGAQVNLMIDCSCDLIFSSAEDLLKKLDECLTAQI